MAFNLEKFFFDTSLYVKVCVDDNELNSFEFKALFFKFSAINIEGYNPIRKVQSTFLIMQPLSLGPEEYKSQGITGRVCINCKRYNDEVIFYIYWNPINKFLMKIGQYPSVADFHLGEVKQYNKVILEEKLKELTRAIGLAANGIGIGSFVYLRRIFEHLINEAFKKANSDNVLIERDFQMARMDEKIDLLKTYLPRFLVENKGMYSILSLGIHELDEETCLAHFDTLRVGIEIILDEKLDEQRKRDKIKSAEKELTALKAKMKK